MRIRYVGKEGEAYKKVAKQHKKEKRDKSPHKTEKSHAIRGKRGRSRE